MSKKWDRLREDFRNTKNPAYFENTLISLANIEKHVLLVNVLK